MMNNLRIVAVSQGATVAIAALLLCFGGGIVSPAAADERVIRTIGTAGTPILYQDAPEFAAFVQQDAKVMETVVQRIGRQ